MRISEAFKSAQRATFQDKTIKHRPKVETTGSLGSVTVTPGLVAEMYQVNFQLMSDALVAQEWGLVVARDAIVTSSERLPIEVGDFVEKDGGVYRVIGHPIFDSHDQLMLQYQPGLEISDG